MQGGPAHGHAAHVHRVQQGHRGELAGSAHLHRDVAHLGELLAGRELPGRGPARSAAAGPHGLAQGQVVHLDHHPVDLEAQLVPLLQVGGVHRAHLVQVAAMVQVILPDVEAPVAQKLHGLGIGFQAVLNGGDQFEREKIQGPTGGDRGVKLAQGPGRGVARVGEPRAAGLHQLPVQVLEPLAGHVHLAAHHQPFGRALGQMPGYGRYGAHVGGHVLTGHPVAPGGGHPQETLLVNQLDGQAVDLGLGQERPAGRAGLVQALEQVGYHVFGHPGLQAEHGPVVAHRGERGLERRAHGLGGRVRQGQLREPGLQFLEIFQVAIIDRVGHLADAFIII